MARVYLSLGSNLDREANLCACLDQLQQQFGRLSVSPVYRCAAVGFEGEAFFNLAVGMDTDRSPGQLDQALKAIEDQLGRRRDRPRFSDRTIDVDLLLYDRCAGEVDGLRLPRDEICEQAFVLRPLCDLIPEHVHPVTGLTLAVMWTTMAAAGHDLEPVDIGWKQ